MTTRVLVSDDGSVRIYDVSDGKAIIGRDVETIPTAVQVNERTIREQVAQALKANATYLAIPTPTNAQIAGQVKALTRQMNGLIRLEVGQLDGTD